MSPKKQDRLPQFIKSTNCHPIKKDSSPHNLIKPIYCHLKIQTVYYNLIKPMYCHLKTETVYTNLINPCTVT